MLRKKIIYLFCILAIVIVGIFIARFYYNNHFNITGSTGTAIHGCSDDNIRGWIWAGTHNSGDNQTGNIGWISTNCYNDYDGNGDFECCCSGGPGGSYCPASANSCPHTLSSSTYGVNFDTDTNKLSGYGWSSNMGWVCFGESCSGVSPDTYSPWACVGHRDSDGNCIGDCGEDFNNTDDLDSCTNSLPDSHLKAQWKLNNVTSAGITNDASGNGNNGTLKPDYTGGDAPTQVKGIWGNALSFDGSNDYVEILDSDSLDITDAITIEAWIYRPSNWNPSDGHYHAIVSKGSIYTLGYGLEVYERSFDSSIKPEFWIRNDTGLKLATKAYFDETWGVNKWTHLAGVFDGENIYIYENGVMIATAPANGVTPGSTTDSFKIGDDTGNEVPWYGKIDNVAIYDRAKTADEIWDDAHKEISGWAKFVNMGDKGWIKLKATQEVGGKLWGTYLKKYTEGGNFYTITGYAWNAYPGSTLGVGWLKGNYPLQIPAPFAFNNFWLNNSVGCSQMVVNWDTSLWAENYTYSRCQSDDSSGCSTCTYTEYPVLDGSCSTNTCSVQDGGLTENTGYCYKVTAHNSQGDTENTDNPQWLKTILCPPDNTNIDASTCGQIIAKWPFKENSDGHNVYRAPGIEVCQDNNYSSGGSNGQCKLVGHLGEALDRDANNDGIKDLVGQWKMNDNWNDSSGEDNNGTAHGNATFVAGKFKKAGTFDGDGDYVEVPDSDSLDITDAITIEAWVKASSFSSGWQGIALKQTIGSYEMWIYGDRPKFGLNIDGTQYRETSTYTLLTDTWYHLSYTFDGQDMKIYVNGDLKNSWNHPGSIIPDNKLLKIGYSGYSAEYFNGLIDNVAIYNVAKTAEQIKIDYEAGACGHDSCSLGGICHIKDSDTNCGYALGDDSSCVNCPNYVCHIYGNPDGNCGLSIDDASTCCYTDYRVIPRSTYYYSVTNTSEAGGSTAGESTLSTESSAATVCFPSPQQEEQ